MKYCPRHGSILDEVDCFDGVIPCPEPKEFDAAKEVLATCGPCDKTRVIPLSRIMQGKPVPTGHCVMHECAATVIPIPIPEGKVLFDKAVLAGMDARLATLDTIQDTGSKGINQAAKPRSPKMAKP